MPAKKEIATTTNGNGHANVPTSGTLPDEPSMLNLIARLACDTTVDVNKLDALLRMQRDLIEDERRIAWVRAMVRTQKRVPSITKDRDNPHTRSRYATLDAIVHTVQPIANEEGLTIGVRQMAPEVPGNIRIVCTVSHEGGYEREFPAEAPPDGQGTKGTQNKTDVQAYGSTVSYLRRYAICTAFNITTSDDDDGEGTRHRSTTTDDRRAPPPKPPSWFDATVAALDGPETPDAWMTELSKALLAAPTVGDVMAMRKYLAKTIGDAPVAPRRAIETMFTAAMTRLAPAEPEAPAAEEPPPAAEEPPAEADDPSLALDQPTIMSPNEAFERETKNALATLDTDAAIIAYAKQPEIQNRMKKLSGDEPAVFVRVKAAFDDRRKAVRATARAGA